MNLRLSAKAMGVLDDLAAKHGCPKRDVLEALLLGHVPQKIVHGLSYDELEAARTLGVPVPPHVKGGAAIHVACQIAKVFRDNAPSGKDLMRMFGMSRPNAYRWRRGWLDANGVAE